MSSTTGGGSPPEEPIEDSSTEGGGNNPNSDHHQQVTTGNPVTRTSGNQRRQGHNKNPQDMKTFKGETAKMNGHVFQLHAERKNKAEFADTMEALRIYASTAYTSDI